MEGSLSKMMLPFKVQLLVDKIIRTNNLCVEDAMLYLYSSQLYQNLSLESSHLWNYSTDYLYDSLMEEKEAKKKKQNNTLPVLLFLSFCLENYKEHKNMESEEALLLFNKYDVLQFLEDVYETLHTQGKEYIMEEIDLYIENRK